MYSNRKEFKRLSGGYPRFVDGHQHVHIVPKVVSLLIDTLATHFPGAVERFRLPHMHAISQGPPPLGAGERFRAAVSQHALEARSLVERAFPQSPRLFVGLTSMDALASTERLVLTILSEAAHYLSSSSPLCPFSSSLPIPVEWMVHPSFLSSAPHSDDFSRHSNRLHEHHLLSSDSPHLLALCSLHAIIINKHL
ncbi:MAG: ChbG/HpnK family deacetylase [archaeon]|nr:ChbG/HpnK family deacetylase [archaeon]